MDALSKDCDGVDSCFRDLDGDGFGTSVALVGLDLGCGGPNEATNPDDCDDVSPIADTIWPGAPETPVDGIDQDCDGVDTCYQDNDGDTIGSTVTIDGKDLV